MLLTEKVAKDFLHENGYEVLTPAQMDARKNYAEKKSKQDKHHHSRMILERYDAIKENLTLQQHGLLLY